MLFTSGQVKLFTINLLVIEKTISVSPQSLALTVLLLTCVGMRAIAGLGILLLSFVTLIHIINVQESLGWKGITFIITSYMSLLLQIKIPGMYVNKENGMSFLCQTGRGLLKIGAAAKNDLEATGNAIDTGTRLVAKSIDPSGMLMSMGNKSETKQIENQKQIKEKQI